MSKPKALVTFAGVPKIAFDLLSTKCEIICCAGDPASRSEILSKVPGVKAIFWSTKEKVDKELLNLAGPGLSVVSTMSVGVDHIDVNEVKSRGILIGNVRDTLNDAVADIGVLLTLAAARRLNEGLESIKNEMWKTGVNWMLGQDIRNSTVGIVGFGSIGQEILKRLKAFKVARFLYTGHREKPEGKELGADFVSLDYLLEESDIVIASCPYTSETKEMFNDEAFGKMKKTAIFVNISRGGVVDQEALIRALETNSIFAAGLDVMTPEPLPANHKLLKLPNCVLMPHLGSATVKTRNDMAEMAARNILAALDNKPMPSPL